MTQFIFDLAIGKNHWSLSITHSEMHFQKQETNFLMLCISKCTNPWPMIPPTKP